MTIYVTKYIHVEVPDYEVELEIEPEEVLNEIDSDELLDHVIDNCDAATILDKIPVDDIIHYIVKDKSRSVLGNLLRKIADYYDYL